MNLTFEGFLKGYCRELSGQRSLSFRKLVKLAMTDAPRVAEPLFLLALAQGKAEYVLGLSEGSWMEEGYRDVFSLYGQADSLASLCAGTSFLIVIQRMACVSGDERKAEWPTEGLMP